MTALAPDVSVVAPAYNEEECVESVVRSWLAMLDREDLHGEVVVANDGSTDRTGTILQELAAEDPRVRVIELTNNQGYGRALQAAIAGATAPWIATMDSDGQFDPDDIPRLMRRQVESGADVVAGCRRRKEDSPLRVVADRGLRLFVRGLFRVGLDDTNCALKLVRRTWIEGVHLTADGFPTPTEVAIRAHWAGLHIEEIDVNHRARVGGASKLHVVRASVNMLTFLLALRLRPRP